MAVAPKYLQQKHLQSKKSNFPIDPSSEIADIESMKLDPSKCPIQIVEAPNAEGKMFYRVREYLGKDTKGEWFYFEWPQLFRDWESAYRMVRDTTPIR